MKLIEDNIEEAIAKYYSCITDDDILSSTKSVLTHLDVFDKRKYLIKGAIRYIRQEDYDIADPEHSDINLVFSKDLLEAIKTSSKIIFT